MSVQLEYNARSMPPADVAKSFIPPEIHFVSLISRNHTLLLGPRGSGKTTLLKMLTLRALTGWTHPRASEFSSQVTFNSAFVPADIAWGKQIDALEALDFKAHRKEAAFVIHTLRALVHAMREAAELGARGAPDHLKHLAVQITPIQEENFAKVLSQNLSIRPMLNSLLGVELALESKL
ncbi:AAA family ATPase, partial [Sinorhizobium meliloti]